MKIFGVWLRTVGAAGLVMRLSILIPRATGFHITRTFDRKVNMLERRKGWLRRLILKRFFTPVYALRLERAWLRPGLELSAVHANCHVYSHEGKNLWSGTIYLHYKGLGSCDSFHYWEEDKALFWQEAMVLASFLKEG
jgi:hypothetical protein